MARSEAVSKLEQSIGSFDGKSPDEIAAMMRARKIKGRPGTTGKCPMALLLNGIDTGRYVIGRKFIVRTSGDSADRVRTPKNVADFVRKFDIGGYPDLIAMPPRCLAQSRARDKGRKRPSGKGKPTRHRVIKNHPAQEVGRFA